MVQSRLSAALAAAALLLLAHPALAAENVIDRWYAALLAVDRDGLSGLLADNARIRLTDLGIEQNKAEFIGSMDEWEAAVSGATIRHRIERTEDGVITVIACYDFPANDMLMQETFAISGDRITANSQATIAETCDGY